MSTTAATELESIVQNDGAAVRVEVTRGRDQVIRLLREAEDLFDRTGTPVCARSVWVTTWLEAYQDVTPVAVTVRSGGRLTGLACLALSRPRPFRTVMLAGDGASDYGALPAADATAARTLAGGIAGVLAGLPGPWRLRLAQLPEDDPVAVALEKMLPDARREPGQSCPQLTFGPERTIEEHMSASGRRNARQGRDRINRTGLDWHMDRTSDPVAIRRILPEIVALHRSRDHDHGRRSDLDAESRRLFYIRVVTRLAEIGQIELPTLWLDGRLGAYFVGIRDGGTYRSWDGRISSEWPQLSLGRTLRYDLITGLLADPSFTGIDWMRGELRHKMQAVSHVRGTEQLTAESAPWVADVVRRGVELRAAVRARVPADLRSWLRTRVRN